MKEPAFYFTSAKTLQRIFITYGNLSDYYATGGSFYLRFDEMLASHLKHMGFQMVLFFDGTVRLECFDEESARLRQQYFPTHREGGRKADQAAAQEADAGEGAKQQAEKQQSTDTPSASLGLSKLSRKKQPDPAKSKKGDQDAPPEHFTENADRLPDYLDRVMRDNRIKSAVIFRNSMALVDPNRRETDGASMSQVASRMSQWYGLPPNNENIAVMCFDIPRCATLHRTLESIHMWNFLFERAFSDGKPTDVMIRIGAPNQDEIKNLLNNDLQERYIQAEKYGWNRSDLESAAAHLVSTEGGSLKALKMFLLQHAETAAEDLLSQYGTIHEDALEKLRTTEGWEAVYETVSHVIGKANEGREEQESQETPFYSRTNLRMAYPTSFSPTRANLSLILMGNPGTGKTTVIQHIATAFMQHGLLQNDCVKKVTRAELVAGYIGQTALETRSRIEEAIGGVLFVDEAYTLFRGDEGRGTRDFGVEAIDTLMEAVSARRGQLSIILAGYPEDMRKLLTANSGLPRRFEGNIIEISDYPPDLLERIFLRRIEAANKDSREDRVPENIAFEISAELAGDEQQAYPPLDFIARDREDREKRTLSPLSVFFDNWFADRVQKDFGNAGAAEELALNVMEQGRSRTGIRDGVVELVRADFGKERQRLFVNRKPSLRDLEKQLEDVVGMDEIKDNLKEIVNYLQFVRAQEKSLGVSDQSSAEPGHYLFVGNPGTGKTMIAEKLGMALSSMGMIQRFQPVRRTGLELMNTISGAGGVQKLKDELESYTRGVLLIDEAHQLTMGAAGEAVLKCLLDPMIEHRNDFCVVFCCYPHQKDEFLAAEAGIARRISKVFYFPDYQPHELRLIFEIKAKKENYIVGEAVAEAVEAAFTAMSSFNGANYLENGSTAEKMLKEIKVSMAMRLKNEIENGGISRSRLFEILPEDVTPAMQRMMSAMLAKRA